MRAGFLAGTGARPRRSAEFERLVAVNPNYAIAYNTSRLLLVEQGRLREGRGLPQALPVPRARPGEPLGFPRRALCPHGPVRRGRGESEEGSRDQGRLLPLVRPPRDGRGGPRELHAGGRVVSQGAEATDQAGERLGFHLYAAVRSSMRAGRRRPSGRSSSSRPISPRCRTRPKRAARGRAPTCTGRRSTASPDARPKPRRSSRRSIRASSPSRRTLPRRRPTSRRTLPSSAASSRSAPDATPRPSRS